MGPAASMDNPPRAPERAPTSRCSYCGAVREGLPTAAPCRSCLVESRARGRVERIAFLELSRRADRFRWWGAGVALSYIAYLVAFGLLLQHFNGFMPHFLVALRTVVLWILLGGGLYIALQMDSIIRHLPAVPLRSSGPVWRVIELGEAWIPGAALALLAMLLRWRVGVFKESGLLLVVYGAISVATISAAVALRYRVRVNERMRVTSRAEPAQQHRAWRIVHVHRSGLAAFAIWLLVPGMIASLPLTDLDRPYPTTGGSLLWHMSWAFVVVSLNVSAILWYAAYLDAARHLRRWVKDAC